MLDSIPADQLLVGDTSMRPRGWCEPEIIRYAAGMGVRIVAGTDPFPFAGQENVVGTYGTLLETSHNMEGQDAIRRLLLEGVVQRVGQRASLASVIIRILRNYSAGK